MKQHNYYSKPKAKQIISNYKLDIDDNYDNDNCVQQKYIMANDSDNQYEDDINDNNNDIMQQQQSSQQLSLNDNMPLKLHEDKTLHQNVFTNEGHIKSTQNIKDLTINSSSPNHSKGDINSNDNDNSVDNYIKMEKVYLQFGKCTTTQENKNENTSSHNNINIINNNEHIEEPQKYNEDNNNDNETITTHLNQIESDLLLNNNNNSNTNNNNAVDTVESYALASHNQKLRNEKEMQIKDKLQNELKPKIHNEIYTKQYQHIFNIVKSEIENELINEYTKKQNEEIASMKTKQQQIQKSKEDEIITNVKDQIQNEYQHEIEKELTLKEKEIKLKHMQRYELFKKKLEKELESEFEQKKNAMLKELEEIKAKIYRSKCSENLKINKINTMKRNIKAYHEKNLKQAEQIEKIKKQEEEERLAKERKYHGEDVNEEEFLVNMYNKGKGEGYEKGNNDNMNRNINRNVFVKEKKWQKEKEYKKGNNEYNVRNNTNNVGNNKNNNTNTFKQNENNNNVSNPNNNVQHSNIIQRPIDRAVPNTNTNPNMNKIINTSINNNPNTKSVNLAEINNKLRNIKPSTSNTNTSIRSILKSSTPTYIISNDNLTPNDNNNNIINTNINNSNLNIDPSPKQYLIPSYPPNPPTKITTAQINHHELPSQNLQHSQEPPTKPQKKNIFYSLQLDKSIPTSVTSFGKYLITHIEKEENYKILYNTELKKLKAQLLKIFSSEDLTDHCLIDYMIELWDKLEISYVNRYQIMKHLLKLNADNLYHFLDRETEYLTEYFQVSEDIFKIIKQRELLKSKLQIKVNRGSDLEDNKDSLNDITMKVEKMIKAFKTKYTNLDIIWKGLRYEWFVNYEKWFYGMGEIDVARK